MKEFSSGAPSKFAAETQAKVHTNSLVRQRSVWNSIWAVFARDLKSEWRARAAWNAVALFSVGTPVALGYALAGLKLEPETLGGLLWAVLFFASMIGLPRAFIKEEETGTAALLRLHFRPEAVLWGKALFQFALLISTQIAAVPLFLLLFNARIDEPGVLLLCLLGGDLGLALASCVLGAIASQARSRGALFPALALPLLLPLLASLSVATGAAFGASIDAAAPLRVVFAFDAALGAAMFLLWEFVWE